MWLEAEEARIRELSAKSIGFQVSQLPKDWRVMFFRSLCENADAKRLNLRVLPKCNEEMLAGFVLLAVRPEVEVELLRVTKERGTRFKAWVRGEARKAVRCGAGSESKVLLGRELLARADRAFDVRRRGLAEYTFAAFVIKEYLHFRSGLKPTARELAALFKAGLAAAGRPAFLQEIHYDLLRRNLKNFEKRRPLLCHLGSGECAAKIIEVLPIPPSS
jgi:hypothetical protein